MQQRRMHDEAAERRRRRRHRIELVLGSLALAVAVATTVVGGLATAALGHTGDQSYLYLDVTETTLSGRIEAPARDLKAVFGLAIEGTDQQVIDELEAELDDLTAYFDAHLDIGEGDDSWEVEFEGVELFFSDVAEIDDNYVLFPFTVDLSSTGQPVAVPRSFDVRFDPFFDDIEGRDALLLIGNDWKGGVIDNGASVHSAYDASNRSQRIDLGDTGIVKNLTASAKLGVNHIKTGPDHILFVLVLLLPSVLVFSAGWRPVDSFVAAIWRVLKIVTMFTVAHSITFTLAGLDILPLPSPRIVESVIAVSIAAAAIHNVRPIAPNKEWLISFVFGLFHGMGFASLVSSLSVDRSTQLVSLLGRNIGIEIGQAVVVVLLFPALYLMRRTHYYRSFLIGASMVLAALSLAWMVERLFETDLGVDSLVDPVVAWPQVLLYVAAFTAIAAVVERRARSSGKLLPTASAATEEDSSAPHPLPVP